jgi:dienelactone hydrolase
VTRKTGILCLFVLFGGLSFFGPLLAVAQKSAARQRQYLQDILLINEARDHRHPISRRVTAQDSTWRQWQQRTGELPPDFRLLPARPLLPDPLTFAVNGRQQPVQTPAQWQQKRDWIKKEFQHWIAGTVPPAPPSFRVRLLSDTTEGGVRLQLIELRFGPRDQARMTFELMIPPGKGPWPVYMTQWTHRNWAQLAVRRGYMGCVYAGADSRDDTQAYQDLYPGYDFTALMRRAWGASRVIDYLLTRPEVNRNQIAITGHSRNGKQALWAAAFDERIAAVVSSSCGTGGVTPWRYSDPQYTNQTLDDIAANAAHWFHPRLRFFFGREDRLPIDQNLLLALVAPRALLLHYSIVERQLNPWATEQSFRSARQVYRFLGAGEKIGVLPRMGEHAVATRDLEQAIDFLDLQFGRRPLTWENKLYFDFSFDQWAQANPVADRPAPVFLQPRYAHLQAYQSQKKQILENLQWLLGVEPAGVKSTGVGPTELSRVDWIDRITGRPALTGARLVYLGPYTGIGDHLTAGLYYPVSPKGGLRRPASGKIPVVIYLHQYAYAHGYAVGYEDDGKKLFQALIDKGFAVLALDMFGFGSRNQEAASFYARYPGWSKMGKMVADVRACVDALVEQPEVDAQGIFLAGNAIGGSVALLTAALDPRVAGVAAVAAFSPWRSSNQQYESIRTYAHLHGFLPRLGYFAESPAAVPVDYAEIISCIAPRPLLLLAPDLDRHADGAAVRQAVRGLRRVYALYGQQDQVQLQTPHEINRLTTAMQAEVLRFYQGAVNHKEASK